MGHNSKILTRLESDADSGGIQYSMMSPNLKKPSSLAAYRIFSATTVTILKLCLCPKMIQAISRERRTYLCRTHNMIK